MTTNNSPELDGAQALRRVVRTIARLQREQLSCDISPARCHVLTGLSAGDATLTELVERIRLEKSWVSRTVDALVTDGLVDRRPGTRDRRTVQLSLTRAGRRQADRLNGDLDGFSEALLELVGGENREAVEASIFLLEEATERFEHQEHVAQNRARGGHS